MSFTIIDAPQRSPEWFAARLGRLTGSRASDMLATIKTGEAAARRNYRVQLVCERLTCRVQEDDYVNADMTRGIELEPEAFAADEALTGRMVRRTGFLAHETLAAGCSLDGDVDDFGGIVEIKCPRSANHFRYLRGGDVPSEHLPQIRHNLWLTEAAWCDFVSFDPRFPAGLQVFIARLTREAAKLDDYEAAARAFLAEVDTDEQAMRGLCAQ